MWLTWCPLVLEHCKGAPTHVEWDLCTCATKFQLFCDVPKDCPQAATHLLYQVGHDCLVYTNEVSLRRFMNSCVCLTMRRPTSSLRATLSHRVLPRRNMPLVGLPLNTSCRHLGVHAILRRTRRSVASLKPVLPCYSTRTLHCPLHTLLHMKLPFRLETLASLLASARPYYTFTKYRLA